MSTGVAVGTAPRPSTDCARQAGRAAQQYKLARSREPFTSAAALVLPATIMMVAILIAPLVLLLRYSLNIYSPTELMIEALSLSNYVTAIADPYYQGIMVATLGVALFCTFGAIALGFPAAYTLARMGAPWKSWLTLLTFFPLMVGGVVRSAGWLMLLGNAGVVNSVLKWAGLISAPLELIYTPGAVIFGLTTVVLPYAILTLASVIENVPRSLEEAALNLGARPPAVFRRVVFPLAIPGVAAASTLIFILCMTAYATPVLLGGANFKMMTPAVYDQFVSTTNWPLGAALAITLLAVTLCLTFVGSALFGRRAHQALR
jgi:putative spermidine/putrescine transport system permease protein